MNNIPKVLTINGQYYSTGDLQRFAESMVALSKTEWERSLGNFLLQWLDEKEFVGVMTSGSTGTPKSIRLSKRAMIASAAKTGKFLELKAGQTALLCLRAEYIAGMMMVVRAMVHQMDLIALPPSGNPLAYVNENVKIDFAAMVPAQVYHALNTTENKQKLESIGTLIIGGAPVSAELEKILENLNGRIYATFGMTETITHIALRRLNGVDRSEIYSVLPGITLETDARGCLCAGVSYIEGGKVSTNDLVAIESPGSFRWLGRADNVINSGGIKLIPEVTEKKIASSVGMRFFIHAIPDHKLGEIPVLVVETKSRLTESDQENLLSAIRPLVDRAEFPKQIFQTERFSETENGKINRKESFSKAANK